MGRSKIFIGLIVVAAGIWIGSAYKIVAQTGGAVGINQATVYHANGTDEFKSVTMFDDGAHGDGEAGDGVYGAEIASYPAGSLVQYMFTYQITQAPVMEETTTETPVVDLPLDRIVINEFMASNTTTIQDAQEGFDDWIELLNVSDEVVDLSGMYLTDTANDLKKWSFPEGTTLAPGAYLIVWADEDGGDEPGLHANFKLAKDGEIISLIDSDDRGNQLIDSITFEAQIADVSFGRYPDGSETLQVLPNATPGVDNLSTGLVADFDGDGSVGFTDFLQFAQQFGKKQGDAGFDSKFDLDGDGNVGFSDFLRFTQHFS